MLSYRKFRGGELKLSKLTDDNLIKNTLKLVQHEREILSQVLEHLEETQRRRLYSELGYRSLFDYAVKHLKYSEGQAQRRISAMRVVKAIPSCKEKVKSGALSLSNIAQVGSFMYQESKIRKVSNKEKLDLIDKISNKTSRAAKVEILKHSSNPEKVIEKVRQVTPEISELKIAATPALLAKVNLLRGQVAHKLPDASIAQVLEAALDIAIQVNRKSVPKKHREIFERDQYKCTNCSSTHSLEVDHIKPRALGGTDDPENLRLLCKSCNQRAAIKALGNRRMNTFLNS